MSGENREQQAEAGSDEASPGREWILVCGLLGILGFEWFEIHGFV